MILDSERVLTSASERGDGRAADVGGTNANERGDGRASGRADV